LLAREKVKIQTGGVEVVAIDIRLGVLVYAGIVDGDM
jgi:hypothetical protein